MIDWDATIDKQAILALRNLVRFQSGHPYDACCAKVAGALAALAGAPTPARGYSDGLTAPRRLLKGQTWLA